MFNMNSSLVTVTIANYTENFSAHFSNTVHFTKLKDDTKGKRKIWF